MVQAVSSLLIAAAAFGAVSTFAAPVVGGVNSSSVRTISASRTTLSVSATATRTISGSGSASARPSASQSAHAHHHKHQHHKSSSSVKPTASASAHHKHHQHHKHHKSGSVKPSGSVSASSGRVSATASVSRNATRPISTGRPSNTRSVNLPSQSAIHGFNKTVSANRAAHKSVTPTSASASASASPMKFFEEHRPGTQSPPFVNPQLVQQFKNKPRSEEDFELEARDFDFEDDLEARDFYDMEDLD